MLPPLARVDDARLRSSQPLGRNYYSSSFTVSHEILLSSNPRSLIVGIRAWILRVVVPLKPSTFIILLFHLLSFGTVPPRNPVVSLFLLSGTHKLQTIHHHQPRTRSAARSDIHTHRGANLITCNPSVNRTFITAAAAAAFPLPARHPFDQSPVKGQPTVIHTPIIL